MRLQGNLKLFIIWVILVNVNLVICEYSLVNYNGTILAFQPGIKSISLNNNFGKPIGVNNGGCFSSFDLSPLAKSWEPSSVFHVIDCNDESGSLEYSVSSISKYNKPSTSGGPTHFTANFMKLSLTQSTIKSISTTKGPIDYTEYFDPNDSSNLTIVFPPGIGPISLIYYSSPKIYKLNFSYASPIINSVSYKDGKVSLIGHNFFNSLDLLNITMDGSDIKRLIISIDHDLIVFKKDIFIAEKFVINLSIGGTSLESPYNVVEFLPKINYLTSVPNRGGPITITGAWFFMAHQNIPVTVDINMGTIPCKNPRSPDPSGTVLICDMPPSNGSEGRLVPSILINSVANLKTDLYFEYALPSVTHYTQQGDKFSFQGENFGTQAMTKFLYNPIKKLSVSPSFINTEQELLNVTLPAGACNGKINIVYSTKVSLPIDFKVIPIFSSITQSKTNGSTITITGKYLQALTCEGAKQQISLKSTDSRGFYCSNFRNNEDKLLCDATQGSGANFSVQLNIGDFSTEKFLFSYEPPIVHSVVQYFDKAIIKGENFGNPTILYFNGINYSLAINSNLEIQFTIPSDSSEGPLVLEVSGQKSKETLLTFGPVITGFSNMTTAGGLFNIHGYFFGHINNLTSITVGNLLCNDPIVVNNETISCNLQDGSGTNWKLSVIADEKEIPNPNNLLFSFDAPKIESYISYLIGNGSIVTVFGMNYHNPVLVTIGGVECHFPNSTDSNTTTCFLPKFDSDFETPEDGNLTIHILVGGQTTESDIFVFNEAQRNDPPPASKMKWLIPAIVIPCFLALLCAVAVTIILVKRHKKMKALRKMFKN